MPKISTGARKRFELSYREYLKTCKIKELNFAKHELERIIRDHQMMIDIQSEKLKAVNEELQTRGTENEMQAL